MSRIFLISPANCSGRRAAQLLSAAAEFPLAESLRGGGAAMGDVFSFISGLYFRGKLTYARRFGDPPGGADPALAGAVHVITATSGLRSPDTLLTTAALRAFGSGEIDAGNAAYSRPLERSARALAREIDSACDVVLLGSVASPKYVDVLLGVFGERLQFPLDFVGRGDMSRGGLLLRAARSGTELPYGPVAGAVLHGPRPARLSKGTKCV